MDIIRAESWSDLLELLFEGSWNPQLNRFRSRAAYRGSSRCDVGLHTSLSRLGGDFAARERHLIRNFRKYARRALDVDDAVWNWLALAKHHGLPTRLLDWSFSPLVALHFATSNIDEFHIDGELWTVAFEGINAVLPEVLKSTLRDEGSDVFTAEMLAAAAKTLKELDALSENPFMLFLEPPSLDERIVNQAALFSLMSDPAANVEQWLANHPRSCRRIILPAHVKWEVRDKLDQANINERVLFPGLDGLSAWLRRYYFEPPRQ